MTEVQFLYEYSNTKLQELARFISSTVLNKGLFFVSGSGNIANMLNKENVPKIVLGMYHLTGP